MKYGLRVREEAAREISEIRRWYDRQRAGLGEEFMAELREGVASAVANLRQHAIYHGRFRRVLLRRFHYKIFYQIHGRRIVVFHVLHENRDTGFLDKES